MSKMYQVHIEKVCFVIRSINVISLNKFAKTQ